MLRLRHTQRGTGLVEYGLALGAVAVLVIVGLNSLSRAQAGYFATLAPSVAAPQAAPVSGPRHSIAVVLGPPCPSSVTAGVAFSCTAFVHDTSASIQSGAPGLTPPSVPMGSVSWYLNGVSLGVCPAALTAVSADTAACTSPSMSVASPGTVTLSASYDPALGSSFLGNDSPVTTITVLAPTPTPTPTPLPTPTPTPTPTPESHEGPSCPNPAEPHAVPCQPWSGQQDGDELGSAPRSSPD